MRPIQDAIFNALAKFSSLSADELVEKVYRGAKEPDWARTCIHIAIHKMRKRKTPFVIETIYKSGRRYRLVFK